MAHRLAKLFAASLVVAAFGCSEQPKSALADATVYKVGGPVRVVQNQAEVVATKGMKLKPTDVIDVPSDSVALILCGNGYLAKLAAETKQAVSGINACTLEPTSESADAQATALLSESEIPLLAAGERVAAADARLHGGTAGTGAALETAEQSEKLAADDEDADRGIVEEAPAAEEAVPAPEPAQRVAAAKPSAPRPPAKTRPAGGTRASQAEASNSAARRALAAGKTKGGGTMRASSADEGTVKQDTAKKEVARKTTSPLAKLKAPGGPSLRTSEKPVAKAPKGFAVSKALTQAPLVKADSKTKKKSKLGMSGRRKTSPALEFTKLVKRDVKVRKCLDGALGAKSDALKVSVVVKDGKIERVSIPGAKSQPACLGKTLGGRSLPGVDDKTFTVSLSRAVLSKK